MRTPSLKHNAQAWLYSRTMVLFFIVYIVVLLNWLHILINLKSCVSAEYNLFENSYARKSRAKTRIFHEIYSENLIFQEIC